MKFFFPIIVPYAFLISHRTIFEIFLVVVLKMEFRRQMNLKDILNIFFNLIQNSFMSDYHILQRIQALKC